MSITFKKRLFLDAVQWLTSVGIELPQNVEELWWLWLKFNAIKPRTFLEIGSRSGGSLYVLSHALEPGGLVISVDLPGGPWGHPGSERNLSRVIDCLQDRGFEACLVIGDSSLSDTRDRVVTLLSGRDLDLLFIDGDHAYNGVRADWELYGTLLRRGGIGAFHDLKAPSPDSRVEVGRLWKEISSTCVRSEAIIVEWGIGVVYV